MEAELKKLSVDDGRDIYEMLQEIPFEEKGFQNNDHGITYEQFLQRLHTLDLMSQGIGLEDWMVPSTTYWLIVDGRPVGVGKIRHRLTERLRAEGGHIGYGIRPSERGRGYGSLLLRLLLAEAAKVGIDEKLITVQNDNLPSRRVAIANRGRLEKVTGERHYYWFDCAGK